MGTVRGERGESSGGWGEGWREERGILAMKNDIVVSTEILR